MKLSSFAVFLLPVFSPVQASIRGVRGRKLQLQLVGYGGKPDASRFPLQLCEGDCDNDNECDEGLVCFQRQAPPPGSPWPEVPGCVGGGSFTAQTDFCIFAPVEGIVGSPTATPTKGPTKAPTGTPSTTAPTEGEGMLSTGPTEGMLSTGPTTMEPTMTPTSESYWDLPELDFVGSDGHLDGMPLGLCQGDCDTDMDCLDEMICFQRVFSEVVPGCRGEARNSMDYCVPPPVQLPEQPIATMVPTSVATMAATEMIVALQTVGDVNIGFSLGLCQGDCDSDGDCLDELICHQRNYLEAVPGCAGEGEASYDYCILNPNATPSPTESYLTSAPTESPTELPLVVEALAPPTTQPSMQPLLAIVDNKDKDKDSLLGLCEGKCKDDADCEGDLVCMDRDSSDDEVPGCGGLPNKADDYCIYPSK